MMWVVMVGLLGDGEGKELLVGADERGLVVDVAEEGGFADCVEIVGCCRVHC